jgi:hypothetical protein
MDLREDTLFIKIICYSILRLNPFYYCYCYCLYMYTTVYSIIGIEYLDGESGNMNRGNLANFINIYDVHTTFSY